MKYGVINPKNGETTIVQSESEAIDLFWKTMIDFAYPYFHNTAYTIIETNADGSETWKAMNGDLMSKPISHAEMTALIEQAILQDDQNTSSNTTN